MRAIVVVAAAALAGCAYTVGEVSVENPDGTKAHFKYVSFKDQTMPRLTATRDAATGRFTNVEVGSESSMASPVIAQQAAVAQGTAQGITEGLIRAMKATATGGLP